MRKFSNHSFLTGPADIQSMEIPKNRGNNPWEVPPGLDDYCGSSDVSLFSSSLPVLRHANLNFMDANQEIQSDKDASSNLNALHKDVEVKVGHDDLDLQGIGSLLPDDEDDLLAGITDDFDLSGLRNQLENLEDDDVFGSGGGLEMDFDPTEGLTVSMARGSITDGYMGNGTAYGLSNGASAVAGEHPYGEHPSRTLFVRNINSNVEDCELRSLFEQYGDIRTLYTACKHRGFVMISYYDIRDARTAMRALQNKPLRRRKLDIHFSIPKDNPSDKDINQGTLVVFNLDTSVSNDDLHQIFGAYGEVKEIRETPHKRHHKFIEFYDVRAAEAALRALNRSDIAGKRIKLEPSRPGGARRNLMQQLSHELEQDENSFRHQVGSPVASSPPGVWGQFGSPGDSSPLHGLSQSPKLGAINCMTMNSLPGLASILPPLSNSIRIPPIGKDHSHQALSGSSSMRGHSSHSLPDHRSGLLSNMNNSAGSLPSFGHATSTTVTSAVSTLTGPQFLWGSPNLYSGQSRSPSGHDGPSPGHSFSSNRQGQGFYSSGQHNSLITPSRSYFGHHVGSAPSGVPLERHFGFFSESPDTSFMNQGGFGGLRFNRNDGILVMNMNGRSGISSIGISANTPEIGSHGFRMAPPQRMSQLFNGGVPYVELQSSIMEGFIERGRNQHAENNGSQIESKQQYQLQLEKIISGEDTRTTLMIKNIPNKYTSKMLLAAIDENHKGTYDFVYLPIDFKNKCNVGYAFINMLSASHIIPFYEAFNGKKWEKFNSEKVASLAYARIQGKPALVSHFQNSSLIIEDKRCRPILFQAEGPEAADQEPFLLSNMNVQMHEKDGPSVDSANDLTRNTSEGTGKADEPAWNSGER